MRKITLFLFVLFTSWHINAQVGIIQSFPNTITPNGWDIGGGYLITQEACATASWRANIWEYDSQKNLSSNAQISNGEDLTITFDYKILNYFFDGIPEPNNPYTGIITTEVSIDGGTTWSLTAGIINQANHIASASCTNISYVVPGASLPTGSNVKVRWRCNLGNVVSSDVFIYLDNIAATQPTSTPPLCVVLDSPANNALNVSSSLLTWDQASGIPTGYKLKVGTASGLSDVLNNFDVGNVQSYNLVGLMPSTTYYVTISPYNLNGDASGCVETNFSTCDSQVIPYTEEFETITTGLPDCWGMAGTTTEQAYNFSSYETGNIGRGLIFNSFNNFSGNTSELTTPIIDATGATSLRLVFYFKNPAGGNFEVLISSDGGATYTSLENNLIGVPNWILKTYNISSYIGDNIKVKFVGTSNYGNDDANIYLDGVVIEQIPVSAPNCSAILMPTNGAINVSSGKITWAINVDASGYKISVGTSAGATNVLNMEDIGNVTNYVIPTSPLTTYFVTLFPYNVNGTATGCSEISFTTCDAFTVPFTEGFDSTSTSESCWTVLNVNNDSDGWDMNYSLEPIVGNESAMLYTDYNSGNNDDWLISPKITLNGNQRVRFQYKVQSSTEPNDFKMLVSTTGVEPSDFTNVILPLTSFSNTTPETMAVSLAGITGNVHIAWQVPPGGLDGYRLYIDNVIVEDIPNVVPTCSTIISPLDNSLEVTNTTVVWTPSLDAAGYKIYVGTAPGTADILNGVNTLGLTSYPVPNIAGTTYYVKVVPFNATGDAVGCTEISFTTCDALLPVFVEQFNVFLPSCWINMVGGDLTTGPTNFTGSRWGQAGFANTNTNTAIRANIYTTGLNSWIISPVVSVNTLGLELKLDAAVTQYYSTDAPIIPWEADDYVQVLVSTTGTNNWTVLHTYDNTNLPSNLGTALIIDLNAYVGQEVRFAIRAVEGADNGAADVEFFFDNFEVRLTPSTVPGCATNVVAAINPTCGNSASNITWDAVSGSDGYRVTVGTTSGGTNIANNLNIGNNTSYSFVGNPATTYFYTIIPFNAAGDAIGCTEMSLITVASGCYCPSLPTSVDGSGITSIQIGTNIISNTVDVGPVYNDHTATPVDVFQGVSNNVLVSFDTGGSFDYNVVIWIDSNDNFSFEASEIVYTGLSTDDPINTLNASFVLPLTIPVGQHRMRIIATEVQQTPSNPCYSGFYAETADFTINVIATASANSFDNASFVAYPNPVKDVFNLSYTSEISSVRVLNLLGQEVASKAVNATSTQVDMSQLSAGTYIVNVTIGDSVKTIKVIKQ